MNRTHSLIFSALIVAASFGSVCAQRRWERVAPPRDPQFYEPRNKLEDFESRLETILIKGRTYVGTVKAQNGYARIEATEIRDTNNSTRVQGVVITIVADGGPPGEIRGLIDYEEIDPLIKAFDTAAKADESITKLTHFEVRYRTKGDFEILVYKQISGGVTTAVEGGFFDRSRLYLTLDDFVKVRWFIAQAKDRLDEIK
jgi:hypothetical protein